MIAYLLLVVLAAILARSLGYGSTLVNRVQDYICRGVTPTALTTPIKMSLHTADPGTTGANEVTGGSYARQNAGYAAASGGACALSATVPFTGMPAVTVAYLGLWSSDGTPLFLHSGALSASKTLNAGDTLNVTSATDTLTSST